MNPSMILIHGLGTLTVIGLLEAVLSADNAVAIASLVRDLEGEENRQRALNWGLLMAFVLRVAMIVLASWVVHVSQIQILGGVYLIWLSLRHFQDELHAETDASSHPLRANAPLLKVVGLVSLTDLAFSLDSVTAAIAITDRIPLVIGGGAIGVLMLRFLTQWVLVWMDRFVNLQNAAYLTVLAVGLRLVTHAIAPSLAPPQAIVLVMMATLFAWGFSERIDADDLPDQGAMASVRSGMGMGMTPKCTSANTTSV